MTSLVRTTVSLAPTFGNGGVQRALLLELQQLWSMQALFKAKCQLQAPQVQPRAWLHGFPAPTSIVARKSPVILVDVLNVPGARPLVCVSSEVVDFGRVAEVQV